VTTVAELIEQTYDHVYGGQRQSLTLLDGAMDASQTTAVLQEVDEVSVGSFLGIEDELLYVRAVNTATRTVTVIRGQRSTTAAVHADAVLVEVNPKFPRYRVRRALQEEIRSWPSDLYRVDEIDIDTVSGTAGYDITGLSSDFLHVLDVQLGPRTNSLDGAVVRPSWEIMRGADTSIYASGTGLILTSGFGGARDVRVTVALPFTTTTFTDATVVETTVGLGVSMVDIPPLGAAARLMVGREIKRTFGEGQPEPRRAEEVPVGSASGTATFLRREVTRRIGEEIIRLRALHPIRRS
jgi:hypothetical protein